jgi:HAMP domain-containing protein
VVGQVPGFNSVTDLTQKPPLEQTLDQIGQVNQQQDAQRQQWTQQRAQEQSQGPGMSR